MKIKPIRDKNDHKIAIEHLDKLMNTPNSKDLTDQITVLSAVIEKYEREMFFNESPSPTAAIKFRMEQKGLTARDLEPYIGSRARVSEVLTGKRKLSIDMMRALHEDLGIPYESLMKKEPPLTLENIEVSQPVLTKLKEVGLKFDADKIGEFLTTAFGGEQVPSLHRRTRSQRASGKTDENALLIWQGAVLTKAMRKLPSSEFSSNKINEQFLISIAQFSTEKNGPLLAIDSLAEHGIIVVILPLLPGTFLDGAVMLLNNKTPVIGLTLRHDRVDNFWFTLLHELAHLARHYELLFSKNHVFFDDLEMDSDDIIEKEADELAKNSLIPSKYAKNIFKNKYASNEDIEKVSHEAGVHISIAAGRWQKENSDYKKFSKLIVRNTLRDALN